MSPTGSMRIAFVLPGLHLVHRGAEAAFLALARELAKKPDMDVTLIGAGTAPADVPYRFLHAACTPREKFRKWPSLPLFRSEYRYEEWSFTRNLSKVYDPAAYDATITCSYPFVQWALRSKKKGGRRPAQIFVTENGDWPARRLNMEYRYFDCEGLVCTNPEYFRRHKDTFNTTIGPNGIDVAAFSPGPDVREELSLPEGNPLFLMVSALIESKHPAEGIKAVARIPGAGLVIAGDGPLHATCDGLGKELMGERYKRITLKADQMPKLYRSADALLHLSQQEAFGNIYIEAAACGLPVVAHDYETPRWILGELGIFVDTTDADALVAALQQAIEQKKDRDSASAHRVLSERFAWPVVADEYHRFLKETISKGMPA